jgi:small GTP-binding protein
MGCTSSYDPLNYEENQKEDYLTKTIFESIMARRRAKIQGEYDADRKEQEDREKELMRQQYLLNSINPRGPKSYVDNLINKEIPKMEFGNLASEEQLLDDLNDRECEEYGEDEKEEETEEEMTESEIKDKQAQNKNEMEELKKKLEELNKKSEEEKGNKQKKKKGEKDGFFGKKQENKENESKNKSENNEEKEEEENDQSKKEKEESNKEEEEENESSKKIKDKNSKNNKKIKNKENMGDNENNNENEEEEDNEDGESGENKKKNKMNKIKSEKNKISEINSKNSQSQHEMETEGEKEIKNIESESAQSEEKEKKLREKMQEKRRLNRQNKMKELMKLKAENPSYADKIKKYKYPKKEVEEKQDLDFPPTPTEITLCVIGEEKNGKTSFIKKYTRNVFEQTYKKTEEIDTYDEIEVEYDSKKIKLNIIDTPPLNQRKYTNLIQENINKSHIIFYIVDINDEYADFKVKLTMQNFEFNEKQIIVIIGNKSDKVSIFAKKNKDSFGLFCSVRKYIFEIISCQDKPKNEIDNFMNNKIIKEYFYLYGK